MKTINRNLFDYLFIYLFIFSFIHNRIGLFKSYLLTKIKRLFTPVSFILTVTPSFYIYPPETLQANNANKFFVVVEGRVTTANLLLVNLKFYIYMLSLSFLPLFLQLFSGLLEQHFLCFTKHSREVWISSSVEEVP